MISISKPQKTKVIRKNNNLAIFEIEDLYPGYGNTIGTVLRRVILSSLPGLAIYRLKIKGVKHEFSAVPYVNENVIDIMLNLKQVRFKANSTKEGESFKGEIKAKGKKEIKAGDIKLPSEVEVVNPDLLIATLTDKKSELELEVEINQGLGYIPSEQQGRKNITIGVIPMDAIYSPVVRVGFEVESMRVGKRTDFDRLRLEIETDGTIDPEEAFNQAIDILHNQLEEIKIEKTEKKNKKSKTKKIRSKKDESEE
ncbi:MAG TPA: DNA-directed RNA polymerase subunit alpha [Candidatus Portnoybacteria bacterium]|nr:DNA-directed RNA polymerase subunit alpha [Candidatus Portnoybacteria bacterium]